MKDADAYSYLTPKLESDTVWSVIQDSDRKLLAVVQKLEHLGKDYQFSNEYMALCDFAT